MNRRRKCGPVPGSYRALSSISEFNTVARARADVLYDHRAGRRAVGLPKLSAVRAIVGIEVKRAVEDGEAGGIGTGPGGGRVDVHHQHRTGRGTVGFPEFDPVHTVEGIEVKRAVQDSEAVRA